LAQFWNKYPMNWANAGLASLPFGVVRAHVCPQD